MGFTFVFEGRGWIVIFFIVVRVEEGSGFNVGLLWKEVFRRRDIWLVGMVSWFLGRWFFGGVLVGDWW